MKCPHCSSHFHPQFEEHRVNFGLFQIFIFRQTCPSCSREILDFYAQDRSNPPKQLVPRKMLYPAGELSRPIPSDLPDKYRQNFVEAILILNLSPNASAALSRRIIQSLLREKAGTKKKDLRDQIDEVLDQGILPSYIADDLHAARNIGNFAAHETKDKLSGEILDVEPGEAEWTLDVAGSMLDFYFVQPAKSRLRRAELNEKLKAAGKPEIKEDPTATS